MRKRCVHKLKRRMTNYHKGLLLVLGTALVSGLSIFLNTFAVAGIDPNIFTGFKNIFVGLIIAGVVVLTWQRREVRALERRDWLWLFVVGFIGGSVPFVLFFNGLVMTTGAKAGFIHKTLFIYVAFLAFFFLKERLTKAVVLGFLALTIGQILFLQVQPAELTRGDALILIATFLWAIELVIAKRLMNRILPNIIVASRMLFGGLFIGIYVLASGQWQGVLTLTQPQVGWIAVTTLLLTGYVMTFYNGLRYVPAHVASSVLALGAPITLLLQAVFQDKTISPRQIIGMALMTASALVIVRIVAAIRNRRSYVLARDHR